MYISLADLRFKIHPPQQVCEAWSSRPVVREVLTTSAEVRSGDKATAAASHLGTCPWRPRRIPLEG